MNNYVASECLANLAQFDENDTKGCGWPGRPARGRMVVQVILINNSFLSVVIIIMIIVPTNLSTVTDVYFREKVS